MYSSICSVFLNKQIHFLFLLSAFSETSICQIRFNILDDPNGINPWIIIFNNLSIGRNKEFCEIPWNFFRLFLFFVVKFRVNSKILPNRVAVLPIDLTLLHDLKLGIVFVFGQGQNLLVVTWLLVTKLVTRKSEYFKPSVPKFLMNLNQLCVVPVRQSSLRRNIDNHVELFGLNQGLDLLNFFPGDESHGDLIY